MIEEKEIKVKILDDLNIDQIKKIIENSFNIKFDSCKHDEDIYYDLEDNFFFNLNHGLRIRNDEEIAYKALFFIPDKIPNPWFVLEKEYKIPINKQDLLYLFSVANIDCKIKMPEIIDVNKLKAIFKKLNFIEKIKIKKNRWISTNENFTICVDCVKKLGLFVEIEVKDDDFLNIFKSKLPFNFKEIRHGYTNLYAKEVLKIKVPNFKEKFKNDPNWNFLKGQKDLIKQILNTK